MKKNLSRYAVPGLIVMIALLLRLPLLDGSFWLDEAAQALESARPFNQQLQIMTDFQPPLLHYLTHFALKLSREEWWLRTVGALIPGILSILGVYLLGVKYFSRRNGVISALLLATSSFHIFYSQELRPYSLPVLWAVWGWYLVFKFHRLIKQSHPLSLKHMLIFSTVSLLGLYSSYLFAFVFISQMLFLMLTHRQRWISWLKIITLVILGFAPWLPSFLTQLSVGQSWRSEIPGWEQVVSYSPLKSLLLTAGKFVFGVADLELTPFFLITTLALTMSLGYAAKRFLIQPRASANREQFWLLIWWLVMPLALAWLVSLVVPVIQPKRVLFLLPAAYLILAELLAAVKHKWLSQGTLLLMVLINLFFTTKYFINPNLQRENWRQLYSQLHSHYPQKETVAVFAFNEPFAPWRWYNQDYFSSLTTNQLVVTDQTPVSELLKTIQDYQFVITFEYLADLSDPDRMVNQTVKGFGYTEVETLTYPLIGQVHVWAAPQSSLSLQANF